MTIRAPEFFWRYLPSDSSADFASLRRLKSSKSKNASSSETPSPLVSPLGGGGAWSFSPVGAGVDSVGGGSICASGDTFFREEQPGARASTMQSPIRATEANRG